MAISHHVTIESLVLRLIQSDRTRDKTFVLLCKFSNRFTAD